MKVLKRIGKAGRFQQGSIILAVLILIIAGVAFTGCTTQSTSEKKEVVESEPESKEEKKEAAEPKKEPSPPKQWVTVIELSGGESTITTEDFELETGKVRITGELVDDDPPVSLSVWLNYREYYTGRVTIPDFKMSEAGTVTREIDYVEPGTHFIKAGSVYSDNWKIKLEEKR